MGLPIQPGFDASHLVAAPPGTQVVVLQDTKDLLQWIDEDQLPVQYGGKNT